MQSTIVCLLYAYSNSKICFIFLNVCYAFIFLSVNTKEIKHILSLNMHAHNKHTSDVQYEILCILPIMIIVHKFITIWWLSRYITLNDHKALNLSTRYSGQLILLTKMTVNTLLKYKSITFLNKMIICMHTCGNTSISEIYIIIMIWKIILRW